MLMSLYQTLFSVNSVSALAPCSLLIYAVCLLFLLFYIAFLCFLLMVDFVSAVSILLFRAA